jgi:hypothetical protein
MSPWSNPEEKSSTAKTGTSVGRHDDGGSRNILSISEM